MEFALQFMVICNNRLNMFIQGICVCVCLKMQIHARFMIFIKIIEKWKWGISHFEPTCVVIWVVKLC